MSAFTQNRRTRLGNSLGASNLPHFVRGEPHIRPQPVRVIVPQGLILIALLRDGVLGRISHDEVLVKRVGESRDTYSDSLGQSSPTALKHAPLALTLAHCFERPGLGVVTRQKDGRPPSCLATLTPPRAYRHEIEAVSNTLKVVWANSAPTHTSRNHGEHPPFLTLSQP